MYWLMNCDCCMDFILSSIYKIMYMYISSSHLHEVQILLPNPWRSQMSCGWKMCAKWNPLWLIGITFANNSAQLCNLSKKKKNQNLIQSYPSLSSPYQSTVSSHSQHLLPNTNRQRHTHHGATSSLWSTAKDLRLRFPVPSSLPLSSEYNTLFWFC